MNKQAQQPTRQQQQALFLTNVLRSMAFDVVAYNAAKQQRIASKVNTLAAKWGAK